MEASLLLDGAWKFKMDDNRNYAQTDWDDSSWQQVAVPSLWDSHGHKDYDGFGWYRTRFRLPENLQDEKLILFLGRIDDVDEA